MTYRSLSTPNSGLRVFSASLLSALLIMMPFVQLAAASRRESGVGSRGSESRQQAAEGNRQDRATNVAAENVFVDPSLPGPVPVPLVGPVIVATKDDGLATATTVAPGGTINYSVNIKNNGTISPTDDATGVTFTDIIDAHTTLVVGSAVAAVSDRYNAIGNVQLSIPDGATDLLGNDIDPDTGNNIGMTATAETKKSTACAAAVLCTTNNVTINVDGSFTYDPPVGFSGTDTFTYTAHSTVGSGTATETVTIAVANEIWFINNNAGACPGAPCDGRLSHPFVSLVAFTATNLGGAGQPGDNDWIFVYESATDYAGPATLRNGQKFIGQDATASLATLTGFPAPSGTDPMPVMNSGNGTFVNITAPNVNGINLLSGNTLRGFRVGNVGTGSKISGTNFGTLVVGNSGSPDVLLNGTGQALSLTTGTLSNTGGFISVTSTLSAGAGINLAGVADSDAGGAGSFSFGSTTISNSTTQGILIGTTPADLNFGTTSITDPVPSTMTNGVSFQNNSAGTRTFGALTISDASSQAFLHGAGGGNVTVTGAATLSSAGSAISVSSPTTNATAINFQAATSATSTGAGVTAVNWVGTANTSMTFNSLSIQRNGTVANPAIALNASGGGTINVTNGTGSINNTTPVGSAIVALGPNLALNANFSSINSTGSVNVGGANGVSLTSVSGTSNFGSGQLTGTSTGATFLIAGGTCSVTYSGNITQGATAAMVSITDHATGAITFQTGTLSASLGTGLQFDTAGGTYNFNGTTTLGTGVGGDAGIDIIDGSAGTFNFGGTTINNPSGIALNVDGSAAAITGGISISGTIQKNNDGKLIDFFNYDTGAATISGTLSCTSTCDGVEVTNNGLSSGTVTFSSATKTLNTSASIAVNLDNNDGGQVNFTGGGLDIDTTTATGFNAINGGTVTVTGSGNTITSTTGTALNVANTTIGANNLNFLSISATGPASGIILNTTGSSGGLKVLGNGGTCTTAASCTGGAIQNTTADAIKLTSTSNVVLTDMFILDCDQSWIDATTTNGLSLIRMNARLSVDHGLRGSTITNLIVQGGTFDQGGASDGSGGGNPTANFDGFNITNLLGNSSIADALFKRSNTRQVFILNNTATNFAGTPDILTVSNNDWNTHSGAGPFSTTGEVSFNGDHLSVSSDTGGNFRLIVNNTGGANVCKTGGICVQATGAGSGKMDAQVSGITSGGTLASGDNNTAGVVVAGTASSIVTFNVANNTMLGTGSVGMSFNDFTISSYSGTVQNNTITHIAGPGTDALQIVSHDPDNTACPCSSAGSANIAVLNNTITGNFQRGIRAQAAFGDATLNINITGNTVHGTDPTPTGSGGLALRAIEVEVGGSGGTTTDNIFLNLESNNAWMDNGNAGYRLLHRAGYTFSLEDLTGSGTDAANISNWIDNVKTNNSNGGAATTLITGAANNFTSHVTTTPPLLFSPGGVESASETQSVFNQLTANWSALPSLEDLLRRDIANPTSVNEPALSDAQLRFMVDAAIARWTATGLSAEQVTAIGRLKFEVADLPGERLAEVTGDLVRIDSDAGGHHWFVDATPLDDVEFGGAVFGSRRYTDHAGAPAGRLDLLTAIEHETGHKLGLADSYAAKDRDSIMYGYLTVGERRVPATGLAANARPGLTGRHFLKLKKAEGSKQKAENSKHHTGAARALTAPLSAETVTANIGTLPAGGSVTITFQVQVNNPPALTLLGPPRVENQGTVSGSNFSNVLTDDLPLLGGAADKTATRIDLFDTSTTLASDVNPSNDGDTVTFTATINETPPQGSVDPTGTVDFIDTSNGNAVICNDVPVSASVATCQVSTLSAGSTHNIRADYSGDGNFEGFPSNILAQVVNACAINPVVTKIADTNDGVCDGDCSLREAIATVCSAPNNNVTFNLGAGPHTLTALSTLVIAKNVNITNTLSGTNGPLTVTANGGNFRVFRIDSPVTTASLSNFTVTGAIATGASGGGLLVQNGTATLTGMLFTGNTVINGGGGGLAVTTGATLNLRNSTVSGNSATFGGGIYNNGGTLNLLNVTVTNNNADGNIGGGPVGGPGAVGGGIDTGSGLATNIKNSIVAANFATTGTNISGTATDQGNNILTGDPMISALADNGGATRTHALLPTSPAVDAGDNTAADAIPLTTDQRGAGFPRKADSADPDTTQTVDIGAFELHPSVENIGNQNTTEDTPINFNFNIGDDTGTLITGGGGSVTATSSNTTLVPNANLSVTDPAPPGGGARNLSITPAANQSGTTTITVTVTATNGRTATDTFDLNVTAANDNPTLTNNTGLTVNEASIANIINNTKLKVDDVDNAPAQLTFTVGTAPTNGTLKNNGVGLSGGGTFTQDDINNNLLTYDHNGSETTSDSFTFTVSDGAGGSISTTTFNITVTPQNDAPTLGNNTGTTVNEGSTGNVIDSAKLSVNDVDNSPVQLTYTVGTAPANGTLKKSGVGLAGGGTFTQLDINNNQLTYDHNGTETTSDSFSFTVSDGAGGSIGSNTFNITVTPQNDGPTVTATGANLAYAEGDPATAVDTGLTVTDSDSANLTGASASITANFQSGQDALGWVDNNPADNITLDGSSTAQTIVLTGTDTPANYQAALRAITYQNSSEDPSTLTRTVTFTANDGTTTGQGTRNIGVSKVNDNPTLTTNAGLTVVNAGTGTIGTTKLKVDDVDNGAPQLTFTVGTATTNGTLKKGVATLSAGGTFTQADIDGNQITYTHNGTATFTDSFTFTVSDGAGGSIASTTFNITIGNPNVSVNDAKVAEPVSPNTTNMIFTVALAAPAGGSGASVDFTTADEPAGPGKAVAGTCGSGGDYTPTSGQVNFAAGQQVKTISVPVCSDGIVEPDETFLLNLSNAVNATLADAQAVGTITTANPAGTLLISEFRQFGPGPGNDPLDDFVEIYNNTDAPITVPAGGYGLFRMPSTCSAADQPQLIGTIPAGVIIPARGHFLFTGPEVNYTLKDYGSTNGGKHNALLTADLGANENFGLFATANVAQISSVNRFDAVGFGANNQNACDLLREGSTLNPLTSNLTLLGQHSFARKICDWVQGSGCTAVPSGSPKDTNQNSVDFRFSDANTTNAGSGQNLGAPGPERAADPGPPNIPGSPIKRDASPGNSGMNVFVLDTSVGAAVGPNRVRNTGDPAGTYGTMTLRYRVFNNTGAPITRLRYRVIDISTAPQPPGIADLRALTGGDVTVSGVNDPVTCNGAAPCMVLVRGTTLETPPAQPNNGGYNSTLSSGTVTLLTPLANGASIPISFVLGVQQTGTFRFYIIVEALP